MHQLLIEIDKIKVSIDNIGPINMGVKSEYEKEKERFDFLCEQRKFISEF